MIQRAALATCCLLSFASVARAQGQIRGLVQDSAGQAIANASIAVTPTDQWLRSDSTGRFVVGDLKPGTYAVRVRRLGFFPEETLVRVESAAVDVTLTLSIRVPMLDTISVTAEGCHRFQFDGFLCRQHRGKGVFLDEMAIDSTNSRFPQDVIRGVAGFRVISIRHGLGLQALTGWRCVVQLVNGRLESLQNPMPRWPGDMIGVEIYADVNDVPAEYRHFVDPPRRCSLVNWWTLVRPRRKPGS